MEVFKQYDLTEAEVKENIYFVTDRGPNIKYGLIRAGFKRITCYAHIIHNLVSAMFMETKVKEIIQKANALCSYVKVTGLNTRLETSLKRHVSTRWNSVYIMLNSILNNFEAVRDLLIEKQLIVNQEKLKQNRPTDNTISELVTSLNKKDLVDIRDFLEPFKVISKKNLFLTLSYLQIVDNFPMEVLFIS